MLNESHVLQLYSVQHHHPARIERLETALMRVVAGTPLGITAMRKVLTAQEFRRYEEVASASFPQPTKSEKRILARFSTLVREGDQGFVRMRKLPLVGKNAMARNYFHRDATAKYGHAHEMLVELLACNPRLSYLFDRKVSEDEPGVDPDSMPRRTTSTSEFVNEHDPSTPTKILAELQRVHLKASLVALAG